MSGLTKEAAPRLRLAALHAMNAAQGDRTSRRDRDRSMGEVYAYCRAIEILNEDPLSEVAPGIRAPEVGTYSGWMILAGRELRKFLGETQWETLGFAAVMEGLA